MKKIRKNLINKNNDNFLSNDIFLSGIKKICVFLSLTGGILLYFLSDFSFSCGFIIGAFIAILNFELLKRIVVKGCSLDNPGKGKRLVIIRYYIRIIITGFLLFVLISQEIVHPLSLLLGMSTVMTGICGMAFYHFLKIMHKETV